MSELATRSDAVAVGDLSSRAEVHDLVVEFYREVVLDEVLEPLFGEVAEVDWVEHIPKLIDYWCRTLLREDSYAGSVTAAHRHLHGLEPIRLEHCDGGTSSGPGAWTLGGPVRRLIARSPMPLR